MTSHVSDRFPDYLDARLSPEEHGEVEAHLRECDACAADLRWASELRDEALRKGARHLSPERIIGLSEGRGAPASEAEAAHLESCPACARDAEWMGSLPAAADEILVPAREEPDRGRRRVVPIRFVAWGGAIAAGLALLLLVPRGGDEVRGLARLEPLPVELNRGAVTGSSFAENRLLGLESYANRDWKGARSALGRALSERPEDEEIRLYLGSLEVLDGKVPSGAALLRPLAETSTDPAVRDEATWILANVALAAGRTGEAKSLLEPLATGDGHRAADARALRERLHDRR